MTNRSLVCHCERSRRDRAAILPFFNGLVGPRSRIVSPKTACWRPPSLASKVRSAENCLYWFSVKWTNASGSEATSGSPMPPVLRLGLRPRARSFVKAWGKAPNIHQPAPARGRGSVWLPLSDIRRHPAGYPWRVALPQSSRPFHRERVVSAPPLALSTSLPAAAPLSKNAFCQR